MRPPLDTPARVLGLADAVLERLDAFFERRRFRKGGGEGLLAALLLAPAFLVLGLFGLGPLFAALAMSLYEYAGDTPVFHGAVHYTDALRDPAFWNSVRVTAWYVVSVVPATLFLSFFIALALHRITRVRGLLRTVYFLPYVTSTVAAAMVWRALFRHPTGAVNTLLEGMGLAPRQWLIERDGVLHWLTAGLVPPDVGPSLALSCVILFDIWHGIGFMVVVFLAGLSSLPRELEEAARLDGAGSWQMLRRITLPLLSPVLFFLLVVGIIRAFQAFNSFYAITQDPQQAPFTPTQNIILFIYDQLYRQYNPGYGAAVSVLFTLAVVALTLAQWRWVGRRVFYS